LVCILGLTFRLPTTVCTAPERDVPPIDKRKAVGFAVLFVLCLLTVLHILRWQIFSRDWLSCAKGKW
ncbi:MAG: hypothetical protein VZR73_15815, partial [Acutalibacteraceae bacterium]|nr:hypothetical protein [Acutalibacteraceae bacterium]